MLRLLREKIHIIGYIIIIYGIYRLGYIFFSYAFLIWANRERTIINSHGTQTIGKLHLDYGNMALVIGYYLFYSTILFLIGIKAIKLHKKDIKQPDNLT
jgi:hypothetical protein